MRNWNLLWNGGFDKQFRIYNTYEELKLENKNLMLSLTEIYNTYEELKQYGDYDLKSDFYDL